MTILVTGGAGFIGSFMVRRLLDLRHEIVVVDDLSRGDRSCVDKRAHFELGTLADKFFLNTVLKKNTIDAVIHFAGFISMGESMEHPGMYFRNNTQATLTLLDVLVENNIKKIIFSSSAGVYGDPTLIPIPEDHPTNPTNPYGESKRMVERLLHWYSVCHGVNSISLRYFNAAGASLDGQFGEHHIPETHLIPLAMHALSTQEPLSLFGTDYSTNDGTCVRDYIHVLDLIEAHVLVLTKKEREAGAFTYNVGTGRGHSNKEVLHMIEKVTGRIVPTVIKDRRSGDAAKLIADSRKIIAELGFRPQFSDLETIISSAWKWHSKVPSH